MGDVERRDIWVEDWGKPDLEAVKASDYDALRAEVERLKREGDARRDTLELRWQDCERLEIR